MGIAMKSSLVVFAAGLAAHLALGTSAHAQTLMTKQTSVGSAATPGGFAYFFPSQWGNLIDGLKEGDLIYELTAFPPPDPRFGTVNGFFDPSQYAADCNTSMFIINDPGGEPITFGPFGEPGIIAQPVQVPVCQATAVPVVNASFLNQLQATGLQFHLVFPIQDNGNGRGYVVWNNPNSPQDRAATGKDLDGPDLALTAGYARIEGVTWQNQFQSFTVVNPPPASWWTLRAER
jgi:hypothetical protein